jgi:hypothetical protein
MHGNLASIRKSQRQLSYQELWELAGALIPEHKPAY